MTRRSSGPRSVDGGLGAGACVQEETPEAWRRCGLFKGQSQLRHEEDGGPPLDHGQ